MGTKILPLVSVFTCVYNMADKIERTFNSIRRQTYPNIEHIIVDDGSTDGVDALIMDYKNSARYTVKHLKQENKGKHAATNAAWDVAEGEFVVQLDADDELLPHAIEFLVNQWEQIPKEFVYQYWCVQGRCCTQYGKLVGELYPKGINEMPFNEASKTARAVSGEKIGLMKRRILDSFRYPTPAGVKFVQENIVFCQININYRTWYTNEIVRTYYVNEGTSLSTASRSMQALTNRCFDAYWRLQQRKKHSNSDLKQMIRYGVCWQFSNETFRKALPYGGVRIFDRLLLDLLYPAFWLVSNLLRVKWKD